LVFAACGPRGGDARGSDMADANAASGFRGVITSPARDKPDFTLTDFNGAAFDFRKATAGKVTLLFFGYTHCPDVCPLHVANIAAVLQKLPFDAREAIRFVFVTTDPVRDTPARLKEWLGGFDPSFIGVRGSVDEVNRILYTLRMPPIQQSESPAGSAEYDVGHAAQVLAFGIDGPSRLEYPFGIRQADWAHDLPKLARGELPAGATAATLPQDSASTAAGGVSDPVAPVRVATAIIPQPPTLTEAALYFVLRNNGGDDTLYAVTSEIAEHAELHETVHASGGGMDHMSHRNDAVVGAGQPMLMMPGAGHVMLMNLSRRPELGSTVSVRLRFRRAGDVLLAANVVAYGDVERILAAAVASLVK
jgi:cytochrome oxidase Cu insertion factor (SCO1/SenC/PrrC family)/copper(I)-binding protein